MPIVLSFGKERNPRRLLRELGFSPRVASSWEERRFLHRLERAPDSLLGGLCLVMGGFMDGLLGKAYDIIGDLPEFVRSAYDVYYREHDEDAAARGLIRRYGRAGRPVIVIGHSWGGNTAVLDVLAAPYVRLVPVQALLTLDPVGMRGPVALPSVQRWRNVYVDYAKADWRRQNNVARIGSPWERVPQAHENFVFPALNHADAAGMFQMFGIDFLNSLQGR